jgi:hypothetical protein
MQSIFLGYLQANLNQSLELPGTQFMGFKTMPKICVFQSIGYTAHMIYNISRNITLWLQRKTPELIIRVSHPQMVT